MIYYSNFDSVILIIIIISLFTNITTWWVVYNFWFTHNHIHIDLSGVAL